MGNENASCIRYLNLEVSEKGLSEFDGKRRIIFIAREDVQKIGVRFGSGAERPVLQVIAGLLLAGLGVAGLVMVFDSGMRGLRWGAGFMVFGCFGAWLLHETLKKTHYLHVATQKEARKLVFRGKFNEAELNQFLMDGAKLGYEFRHEFR